VTVPDEPPKKQRAVYAHALNRGARAAQLPPERVLVERDLRLQREGAMQADPYSDERLIVAMKRARWAK
jgi:hypothetical protein